MLVLILSIIVLAVVNIQLREFTAGLPDKSSATPTIIMETATFVNPLPTAQPKAPWELQDCDFHLLYGGASALEPPFDVADSVNLRQWQAAWRNFGELTRLIDIHQEALIGRHGTEEFKRFRVDLKTLVEKPLRYGCSTLQSLQVGLLEFRHMNIDEDYEHRVMLSNMLREAEIGIVNNTLGMTITHLLPSWARQAPELRSERCLSQDCFKIGETALDIAMLQLPIELINGVRKVQSDTVVGGRYATNKAGSRVFGNMTPWGRVTTSLMPDLEISNGNSEPWITHIMLLGAMVVFILSTRVPRRRAGLLWLVGLLLVIIAICLPQDFSSLKLGNFNTSDYWFGGSPGWRK
ncbi:hypothetical protein F5B21DRAFT_486525 [Xylaria acuta]|nr:hypothetical protein F5B21DRAFT_486525 [Xylaria acuta]